MMQKDFGVQIKFKNSSSDSGGGEKYLQAMISDERGKKLDAVMMALRSSRSNMDEDGIHKPKTVVKFMKMKSKDEATYKAVAKIIKTLPPESTIMYFLYRVREYLLDRNR